MQAVVLRCTQSGWMQVAEHDQAGRMQVLALFLAYATVGGILVVSEIKAALDQALGRKVKQSS